MAQSTLEKVLQNPEIPFSEESLAPYNTLDEISSVIKQIKINVDFAGAVLKGQEYLALSRLCLVEEVLDAFKDTPKQFNKILGSIDPIRSEIDSIIQHLVEIEDQGTIFLVSGQSVHVKNLIPILSLWTLSRNSG